MKGTALERARKDGMARNAAVVLGNVAPRGAEKALAGALQHPAALVRQHAAWALGTLATPEAEQTLREARQTEADEAVLAEMDRALKTCSGRGSV